MRDFKVKDLLVSIGSGHAVVEQGERLSALHIPETNALLAATLLSEKQLVKCIQPSKAILGNHDLNQDGPTKRKATSPAGVEPCPCPSKAPEGEEIGRRNKFSEASAHGMEQDPALAELKQLLASMQSSTLAKR